MLLLFELLSGGRRGDAWLLAGGVLVGAVGLVLGDVQMRVDDLRYGLDLGAELLLDLVQSESVLVGDQVDGNAEMSEAARATDTMQVGLGHLGEVEVDDHVDGLDVDTAREQVRADEIAARAVAEVVEDAVAVVLAHLGVDVEARVAELGDLLGQELDTLRRVAENDRLIDLQLHK